MTTGISAPDSDWQFLSWVYDRLKFVYKEHPSLDYMRRFKEIIDRMEEEERCHY